MKVSFVLAFLALATVMVYGQDQSVLLNQLTSFGTGVVLVPIDRAALTITATGMADTAAQAVADANNLQSRINDTLRNFTIIDIRNGGLFLEPVVSGSALTFAAHKSLSVVINAVDTPALIDSMVALGASNISFIFTPDFFAVARAQRESLQLAIADALFRAQSVLDTIGHCAFNISYVAIKNPALELPSLTFNLFANMGNLNNLNTGRGLNINRGSEMLNNMNNMNNQGNNQGSNMNNNNLDLSSRPMMLGAAAPFLEGDKEEVISYVEIWITHAACSAGGSGMITDLTSSLDLSNVVGISGGMLGSPSGSVASASGSVASAISGSEVASASGSELGSSTLGVRSTNMW